jgi:hypothetical protein
MDLRETPENVKWISLNQARVQWRAFVSKTMNHWFHNRICGSHRGGYEEYRLLGYNAL